MYFCLFLYNEWEEICEYVTFSLEEFWKNLKASNKIVIFFNPAYFCPFSDIEHVNK